MQHLPERIEKALEKIRQSHSHYVDIKIINGRAYVYESTSRWDKKLKQIKKLTKYIGRITESGEFIPSNPRNPDLSAAAVLDTGAAHAAKEKKARNAAVGASSLEQQPGKYDAKILEELSSDGRITLPELSKKIGLSVSGTEWQKNSVEKRYGIRYVAEIDVDKLGYLTYIIMVKFVDKVPSINEMKEALSKEKYVQFAILTQGEYDLIIYILTPKYGETWETLWEFFSLRGRIFPNYNMKVNVAPFYQTYSFVPLREAFFDILSERTSAEDKSRKEAQGSRLLRRDFAVLKELNFDGTMDFTEIDSKYRLVNGSARYTYHKLLDSGIIKRVTISIENIHVKYILVILLPKINHEKYIKDREKLVSHIIEQDPNEIINRYTLEGDIKVPEGVLLTLPVLNDSTLESTTQSLSKISGTSMVSLIGTSILVGNLCYRRLNAKNTMQYKILKEEYGLKE